MKPGERPKGTHEAAHYLGCVPATLTYWARHGKLPAYHIEGRRGWFFFRSEIEAVTMTPNGGHTP